MGNRNIKYFLNLRTKWISYLFFAAILSLFIGTQNVEAQVKIDNKKLQTSPTSKVQVKGKQKRSKKRRGDRKVSKKEKSSPRETKRARGEYEKPRIRTSGRKGEKQQKVEDHQEQRSRTPKLRPVLNTLALDLEAQLRTLYLYPEVPDVPTLFLIKRYNQEQPSDRQRQKICK